MMNKNKHLTLWGYFFMLSLPFSFAQIEPCEHPDYLALSTLYQATGGDTWSNQWDLSDCAICDYYGITCNDAKNRKSTNLESAVCGGAFEIK